MLEINVLPLLLLAAPVFSDETTNKMLPQILVTNLWGMYLLLALSVVWSNRPE